jgi:YVTN family beta-propeller protein
VPRRRRGGRAGAGGRRRDARLGRPGRPWLHVTAAIPVGIGAEAVAEDPATRTVYVGNYGGGVPVINEATNTVTATIPADADNEAMTEDPVTRTVYAASLTEVSVIDEATNTVTATIERSDVPNSDQTGDGVTFGLIRFDQS